MQLGYNMFEKKRFTEKKNIENFGNDRKYYLYVNLSKTPQSV